MSVFIHIRSTYTMNRNHDVEFVLKTTNLMATEIDIKSICSDIYNIKRSSTKDT